MDVMHEWRNFQRIELRKMIWFAWWRRHDYARQEVGSPKGNQLYTRQPAAPNLNKHFPSRLGNRFLDVIFWFRLAGWLASFPPACAGRALYNPLLSRAYRGGVRAGRQLARPLRATIRLAPLRLRISRRQLRRPGAICAANKLLRSLLPALPLLLFAHKCKPSTNGGERNNCISHRMSASQPGQQH